MFKIRRWSLTSSHPTAGRGKAARKAAREGSAAYAVTVRQLVELSEQVKDQRILIDDDGYAWVPGIPI